MAMNMEEVHEQYESLLEYLVEKIEKDFQVKMTKEQLLYFGLKRFALELTAVDCSHTYEKGSYRQALIDFKEKGSHGYIKPVKGR